MLIATPTDGNYQARVKARNGAGVWSEFSDTVSTVVDTIPPAVSIVKPTAVGISMSNRPNLVVATNEPANCYYQNASFSQFKFASDIILGAQLYHETQVNAGNGQNVFTIRCRDLVGNEATAVMTFNVNSLAYPDSVSLAFQQSYYARQVASVSAVVSQQGVGIMDAPKSLVRLLIDNSLISSDEFVWTDNGGGSYNITFIAPNAGAHTINLSVGNGRVVQAFNVNELSLTVQFSAFGMSPENTSRIAYARTPSIAVGLASDSSKSSLSASSNLLQISSSEDGSTYIFATKKDAEIKAVDSYLKERSFIEMINPSFGYPIKRDVFVIDVSLIYDDIAIVGNRTLGAGRYDLLVRNLGFNRTINKTMVQVDLRESFR